MSEYQLSLEEQQKLNGFIDECVKSMIRTEAESSYRKDVAARAKEELGFGSALFNSLVKERYENKSSETVEKHQDIIDLNEMLSSNRGVTRPEEE